MMGCCWVVRVEVMPRQASTPCTYRSVTSPPSALWSRSHQQRVHNFEFVLLSSNFRTAPMTPWSGNLQSPRSTCPSRGGALSRRGAPPRAARAGARRGGDARTPPRVVQRRVGSVAAPFSAVRHATGGCACCAPALSCPRLLLPAAEAMVLEGSSSSGGLAQQGGGEAAGGKAQGRLKKDVPKTLVNKPDASQYLLATSVDSWWSAVKGAIPQLASVVSDFNGKDNHECVKLREV